MGLTLSLNELRSFSGLQAIYSLHLLFSTRKLCFLTFSSVPVITGSTGAVPVIRLPLSMEILYCKEIKPMNPKGNQLLIFIGKTDAQAEASVFWLSDMRDQLISKDPDTGKD